ncbi:hypothetical protein HOE04_03820 [archaeon]|jgi:ornithine decarboxylase|nr:hypothetical protein [archaeon]
MKARFVLNPLRVVEEYDRLKELGVKVSYSFKTNHEVGKVLDEISDSEFSVHNVEEIDMISGCSKIWFFTQAYSVEELKKIVGKGVENFVVDNEQDLGVLLECVKELDVKINLLLRMKFQEHRITTGKYHVYGMSARKVNEIILGIKDDSRIGKLGIHIHRKSQNASEWEIKSELEDSLCSEVIERIDIINLGGGLPVKYRTYTSEIMDYIFGKIREVVEWFGDKEVYIEPGRFIAGPAVKLECEIIQIQEGVIVVNTSIYNCALDSMLTDIRLLIEGEVEEGDCFKIKGNTPTRDDIFRYDVKLSNPQVGDKIVFLNAGAYNYSCDFCGLKKLDTIEEKKIVGVPMSMGCLGKNVGCEKAPLEILNCKDFSMIDIDENDFVKSVNTLEKVEGDIFVGGDHSITYPLFKGFASGRENVGLIVFDAHPDCVNNFSPPTHEDYLRVLVEEGVVGCSQVLLVGLRKIDEIEKKFLGSRGIEYVCYSKNRKLNSLTQKNKGGGAHCFSDGDEDISSKIEEFLSKVDDVYLSVDIDVLNSKFAPGTGYVEEGGFGLDELVGFLKIVCGSCKVGRVDLVEVNPDKDVDGKTVESAKKILEIFVDGN